MTKYKKIQWGYPTKSWDKICRKLETDLKFYGGDEAGNCACLICDILK